MTWTRFALILGLAFSLSLSGCDFLDPTETENPQTTDEELAEASDPVSIALPGARAQFSRAIGASAVTIEVASDNYSVHGSGLSDGIDFQDQLQPRLNLLNTSNSTGLYWNTQELRGLSLFILNELAPNDENVTEAQLNELRFYVGMSLLIQGENFVALPVEEGGAPVPAASLLESAIGSFQDVLDSSDAAFQVQAQAALARTYRALGESGNAADAAQAALDAGGDDFLFVAEYDRDTLDNPAFDFLIQRALQEMQPLPRLDFLDPKLAPFESGEEPSIPYAKAEEMHLILAEVALSDGQPGDARGHMSDALDVVDERITGGAQRSFFDDDARFDNSFELRPRSGEIVIAFAPGEPFQSGLVLDRPGTVTSPTVSGTSVAPADLGASTDAELTYWLYLMRQEIFLLEGRRLHDLGIRLPIMQREIDASPTIAEGDTGTEASVPTYIPAANTMDTYRPAILYDEDGNLVEDEVVMDVDMNRVLTDQRGLVIENTLLSGSQQ